MSEGELKNDEFWRDKLSPDEYAVCREKGTERPFTGAYCDEKRQGCYRCRCCNAVLFDANTKYDSGSGWPSFYQPAAETGITETIDATRGMVRTEITCQKCNSHLGHVFTDGPKPTGMRYCVNSTSLRFEASGDLEGGAQSDASPVDP